MAFYLLPTRAWEMLAGGLVYLMAHRLQLGMRQRAWLGTRSYSIYFWHWPIVVALGYFEFQANVIATVAGLTSTMLLGDLSYRIVETRKLTGMRMQWSAVAVVCGIFVVAIPSAWIRLTQ